MQLLCADPPIYLLPNFVTMGEATHLIARGDKNMDRSRIVCDDPRGCVDPRRTSESAHLSHDAVTRRIARRACKLTGFLKCEALQVVRYHVGQEFKPHFDAFDTDSKSGAWEVATGGQRAATLFVYLQRPLEGGATDFPTLGLSVAPTPLAAVYWLHHLPNGELDPRVLHGGAPVKKGVKYGLNIWLRLGSGRSINEQLAPKSSTRAA